MQVTGYDDNDDEDDDNDENDDSSVTRKRTFSEIGENQPHDETEIEEHEELDTGWSSQEETEFSSDEEMLDNDAKFNKRNRIE